MNRCLCMRVSLVLALGFIFAGTGMLSYFTRPVDGSVLLGYGLPRREIRVIVPAYSREEVNGRIETLEENGDFARVLDMYGEIAGDRDLASSILERARAHRVPVNLLFALIQTESDFDPHAKGKFGEIGLMQLHPATFVKVIKKRGTNYLWPRETNLEFGVRHLTRLNERKGDWDLAVYRYNGRGEKALAYLLKIQRLEKDLDRRFSEAFNGALAPPAGAGGRVARRPREQ
jgi:hypothetical protein